MNSTIKTIRNLTLWTASAILFPFRWPLRKTNLKQLALWSILWLTPLQPASTLLFPSAKDSVKEEGLDPKIVEELAPGKIIHVLKDNFVGQLHEALNSGPYMAPLIYFNDESLNNSQIFGYTFPSISYKTPLFFSYTFQDVCSVYMKSPKLDDDTPLKEMISQISGGEYESRSLRLSPQDEYKLTKLHEIRHCSDDNHASAALIYAEGDADYHALITLARETNKPELKEAVLFKTALNAPFSEASHNTTLYLDLRLRGEPLPDPKDMLLANVAAAPVMRAIHTQKIAQIAKRCSDPNNAKYCNYDVEDAKKNLSPLARRYVDIYREALNKTIVPTRKLSKFKT